MTDWVAESRRIRAGIKPIPKGYPFHLRPDLKGEHDRLEADGRKLLAEAAEIKSIALGG